MTLDEIRNSDKPTLNAADVAQVIGCDPHAIRIMAHENPAALGFPVVVCGKAGRRVRIPRLAFLRFMGEEAE